MKRISFLLITMLMLSATNAFSAGSWFSAGTKVTRVVAHDWGEVALIYLESNVTYPSGCPTNSVVAIKKESVFFQEIWQTAMTALVTQKTINGWMIGECYRSEYLAAGLGMPYINRLDIFR